MTIEEFASMNFIYDLLYFLIQIWIMFISFTNLNLVLHYTMMNLHQMNCYGWGFFF